MILYFFIHLLEMYCNDDSYHNCRYFFQKSNQSEDMKICMNYRWNLRINAIQKIKFHFISSIQNPRQLACIIVNINLSIIFFPVYYCIQNLNMYSISHSIALPLMLCILFTAFQMYFGFTKFFFSIPMSTANRIFQYCYWFSISNKLKRNKKNWIMILHMLRLMDETRFCLLAGYA